MPFAGKEIQELLANLVTGRKGLLCHHLSSSLDGLLQPRRAGLASARDAVYAKWVHLSKNNRKSPATTQPGTSENR
jgi:hypothetical protein